MITTRGPQDQHGGGNGDEDATLVEGALRSLRWEVPASVDAEVMSAAGAALDAGVAAAAAATRDGGQRWWRGGGRFRGVVAALALALVGIVVWAACFAGPSVTLTEVVDAAGGHPWVHVRYDTGVEDWFAIGGGARYSKSTSGNVSYHEPSGRRLIYWAHSKYIAEDSDAPRDGESPAGPAQGKDAWRRLVAPGGQPGGRQAPDVERHRETLPDHGRVVRFDTYQADAAGGRELVAQLWADPDSRLPLRTRHRLPAGTAADDAGGGGVQREWTVGEFSFPEKGPASLIELGVPRDTPVVKYDAPVPPDVQALLKASQRAVERFPKRYRAVHRRARPAGDDAGPVVLWRDDKRLRRDAYENPSGDKGAGAAAAANALALPASAEQVLAWTAGRHPVDVQLFDGTTLFHKVGRPAGSSGRGKEPYARVVADGSSSIDLGRFPHAYQWLAVPQFTARRLGAEESAEEKEVPDGCVGFRQEQGGYRHEYWIDPAHDFLLVREVRFVNAPDGASAATAWRRDQVRTLGDLAQLPEGQWYARVRTEAESPPPGPSANTGGGPSVRVYHVDVTPASAREFPKGLFDGAALTQGVKIVPN